MSLTMTENNIEILHKQANLQHMKMKYLNIKFFAFRNVEDLCQIQFVMVGEKGCFHYYLTTKKDQLEKSEIKIM